MFMLLVLNLSSSENFILGYAGGERKAKKKKDESLAY